MYVTLTVHIRDKKRSITNRPISLKMKIPKMMPKMIKASNSHGFDVMASAVKKLCGKYSMCDPVGIIIILSPKGNR